MRRVVAESNYGLHSGGVLSSAPTNSPLGQQGVATFPEYFCSEVSQYLYPTGLTLYFVASLAAIYGHFKFTAEVSQTTVEVRFTPAGEAARAADV
jgi:hypothetical protein